MSEWLYRNLNTDIDSLCKANVIHKYKQQNTAPTYILHTSVQNISDITFDNAETFFLEFGLNCNFEKSMKFRNDNWHWQCRYTIHVNSNTQEGK
jgi:hypothetical protein